MLRIVPSYLAKVPIYVTNLPVLLDLTHMGREKRCVCSQLQPFEISLSGPQVQSKKHCCDSFLIDFDKEQFN